MFLWTLLLRKASTLSILKINSLNVVACPVLSITLGCLAILVQTLETIGNSIPFCPSCVCVCVSWERQISFLRKFHWIRHSLYTYERESRHHTKQLPYLLFN